MKRLKSRISASIYPWIIVFGLFLVFSALPVFAADHVFISEPQTTLIDLETLDYTVTWETDFTPLALYVQRYSSGGPGQSAGYQNWAIVREGLSAQGSYTFPAGADSMLFRIHLVYDSAGHGITSQPFSLSSSPLEFTVQPKATFQIDPDTLEYPITWQTNFTPKKVYVEYYSSGGPGQGPGYKNYMIITENLSSNGSCTLPQGAIDKVFRLAIDYGSFDLLYSSLFSVTDSNLEFTSEPEATIYIDPETLKYPIDWATNFTPARVLIRHQSGSYGHYSEMTYDELSGPFTRSGHYELPAGTYRSAHPFWIDADYSLSGLGKSTPHFYLSVSNLEFTTQPDSIAYANSAGSYPIFWKTNFTPVKMELVSKSFGLSVYQTEDTLTTNLNKEGSWLVDKDASSSCSYYLRAYFSDRSPSDEPYYIQSDPFKLHEAPAFTKQPVSTAYAVDDESCTITWKTNFDPSNINIIGIGEDGTPLNPPVAYIPNADSTAYDLTLPEGMDVCDFRITASYKPGSSVQSTPFTVNKLRYLLQPSGGTANASTGKWAVNWQTNFVPVKYDILQKNGNDFEVTDTILPNNGNKRYYPFQIDTTSAENSFTYKVRSYFNDDIWVDSQEIVIWNPAPVTLTLQYPQGTLVAKTYTLQRGQSANMYLGSLPLGELQSVSIEGWYADAGFTIPYSGDEPVNEDTTIYAKTTARTYTITFVTNGGSSISPLHLPYGSTINAPSPTRSDYLFAGWYLDSALTDNFNQFIHTVNGDRTLYAKWIPDGIAINAVNFPDEVFRTRLISGRFDTNGDGTLTSSEINNATSITANLSDLADLRGIEYLTELQTLTLLNSQITSVDLSHNTKLTFLRLEGSSQMTSVNLGACTLLQEITLSGCALTKLDVTMLPNLTTLRVQENPNLSQLYVNGSTLEILVLHTTAVETLDLSGCAPLSTVYRFSPTDCGTYESHRGTVLSKLRILTLDKDVTVYLPGDCVEINETNFPDAKFREYVGTNLDTNSNGWLNPDELAAVDTIFLMETDYSHDGPVFNLKGIEFFTQLTHLYAIDVSLNEVDLSGNLHLKTVYLQNDDLERIDVSMLPELESLNVRGNHRINEVILGNSPVKSLSCYDTGITFLDLSGCPYLAIAAMEAEPDMQENDGIEYVRYFLKFNDFAGASEYSYDLQVDPDTEFLLPDAVRVNDVNFPDDDFRSYVEEYFDTYSDGWLSENEIAAVTGIYCGAASLKGIEFFTELEELECYGTSTRKLKELDLRSNKKLTYVECIGHELTEFRLDGLAQLSILDCSDNGLTDLDVSGLSSLAALFCSGNSLTNLDVTGCPLEELYCESNPLEELVTGDAAALRILYCYDVNISELDLTGCPLLCSAVLSNGGTEGTDSSGRTYLQYYDNATNARLRVDPAMRLLIPGGIPLTEANFPDEAFRAYVGEYFDANGNGWLSDDERSAVTQACCENLGITSLQGLEFFPNLQSLECDSNLLEELNLAGNPALTHVECEGMSSLQSLDVTALTGLTSLFCSDTSITELDLHGLENLTVLHCASTQLNSLDVSGNPGLGELWCNDLSSLTELVLGEQNSLYELHCEGTPLETLDLTGCPILKGLLQTGTPEEFESGTGTGINSIRYTDGSSYISFSKVAVVYSMTGAGFADAGKQLRLLPGQTVRLPQPQLTVYYGAPQFRYTVSSPALTADGNGVVSASAPGRYTLNVSFDGRLLGSCDIVAKAMDTLQLPAALQTIGEEAFASDSSAERIVIGANAMSIGSRAFADSGMLSQIVIPSGVTSIAPSAFENSDPTIVCTEGSAAHQFAAGLDGYDGGYVFAE